MNSLSGQEKEAKLLSVKSGTAADPHEDIPCEL